MVNGFIRSVLVLGSTRRGGSSRSRNVSQLNPDFVEADPLTANMACGNFVEFTIVGSDRFTQYVARIGATCSCHPRLHTGAGAVKISVEPKRGKIGRLILPACQNWI